MRPRRTVLGALVIGLLAACSTPLPEPQPDAVPAATPPALFAEQAEEVLEHTSDTLALADESLDATSLEPRVTGPAATVRGVEYALAAAAGGDAEAEAAAITAIPGVAQTLVLPTTERWPRTFMVVTEPPEDLQAPLLLTLVQEAPREQYRLWSWARLFPGVQMPATAEPGLGSAPVGVNSQDLAVAPNEVVERYVDVLTNRDTSEFAESFTADPLRQGIAQTKDAFVGVVGRNGTLTETYQPDEAGAVAMATADGGAIVVGTIRTVTTITLADSTLKIADQTAVLLGTDTVRTSLEIQWLSVVAFAVPPAGSTDPVEVLGAEHSRVQVTGS